MQLPVGKTFVYGVTRDNARALLAAARRLGLDPSMVVRTVEDGFVVPNAVYDELALAPDVEEPESASEPETGFDPHTAGYNELKAEAARRFGPGGGSGTREQLIAKLTAPTQPQEG